MEKISQALTPSLEDARAQLPPVRQWTFWRFALCSTIGVLFFITPIY